MEDNKEKKFLFDPSMMSVLSRPVDSKATAMQYALETTATFTESGKIFNYEKAMEVYRMFVDNIDLPESEGLAKIFKDNFSLLNNNSPVVSAKTSRIELHGEEEIEKYLSKYINDEEDLKQLMTSFMNFPNESILRLPNTLFVNGKEVHLEREADEIVIYPSGKE